MLFISSLLFGQSTFHFNQDLPCVDKQFNIFVHAVNNHFYNTVTEDKVKEAIDRANKLFAPICVSFKFCEMDTVFNYNYNGLFGGEMKELAKLYVQHNRINLYIITEGFYVPYIGEICLGSIDSLRNANLFVSFLSALPQALGHFFGLKYTFYGIDELVDGSNCETAGDKICDTPADPYNLIYSPGRYIDASCHFKTLEYDANGMYYEPDVTNIMSIFYKCHCKFSIGQYKKMAENIINANKKHW